MVLIGVPVACAALGALLTASMIVLIETLTMRPHISINWIAIAALTGLLIGALTGAAITVPFG
jgi:hypothetical protein